MNTLNNSLKMRWLYWDWRSSWGLCAGGVATPFDFDSSNNLVAWNLVAEDILILTRRSGEYYHPKDFQKAITLSEKC